MTEDQQQEREATGVNSARQRLASVLATIFRDNNYASPYLARRCRTTPEMVIAWTLGEEVPTEMDWEFLCRFSREFLPHFALWEAARWEAARKLDARPIDHDGAPTAGSSAPRSTNRRPDPARLAPTLRSSRFGSSTFRSSMRSLDSRART